MSNAQRYVSNELTHFVGGNLQNMNGEFIKDLQFTLFLKILKEGWITHPPHSQKKDEGFRGFTSRTEPSTESKPSLIHPILGSGAFNIEILEDLTQNKVFNCPYVCFCDIPHGDLSVHMAKYGSFGISFRKPFLIARGANPVFYIANDSVATHLFRNLLAEYDPNSRGPTTPGVQEWHPGLRGEYFSGAIMEICQHMEILCMLLGMGSGPDAKANSKENRLGVIKIHTATMFPDFPQDQIEPLYDALQDAVLLRESAWSLIEFLYRHVFGFMKFFDSSKIEGDPENYYMEREWRLAGDLKFSISDVYRIYLPQEYAVRFRWEISDYAGQVSFTE